MPLKARGAGNYESPLIIIIAVISDEACDKQSFKNRLTCIIDNCTGCISSDE